MRIKLLEFIASIASVVSLIITVFQWEASNIYSRLLFLIAFIATGLLVYLLYEYSQISYENSRLRSKLIPELIHLKGACAYSDELSRIVNRLNKDDLNEGVHKILLLFSTDTSRRLGEINSNNEKLKEAERLTDPDTHHISKKINKDTLLSLQSDFKKAYTLVHEVDRNRLRQEKLEQHVYHDANNDKSSDS